MGDAAGELADRLHLLGLAQGLFGPLEFGDVLYRPHHLQRTGCLRIADHFRHVANDDLAAVGPKDAILDVVGNPALDSTLDGVADHRMVFHRDGFVEALVRYVELAGLLAEDAEGLIGPAQRVCPELGHALEIVFPAAHLGDALGRGQIGLALTQGLVTLDQFRHIGADGNDAAIGQGLVARLDPTALVVLEDTDAARLTMLGEPSGDERLLSALRLGVITIGDVGANQRLEGLAERIGGRALRERLSESAVDHHYSVVGIVDGKPVRDALDGPREKLFGRLRAPARLNFLRLVAGHSAIPFEFSGRIEDRARAGAPVFGAPRPEMGGVGEILEGIVRQKQRLEGGPVAFAYAGPTAGQLAKRMPNDLALAVGHEFAGRT